MLLIDFDWAADGVQRKYPAALNFYNPREDGVFPCGVMHKVHDLWQLDYLKKQCGQDAWHGAFIAKQAAPGRKSRWKPDVKKRRGREHP